MNRSYVRSFRSLSSFELDKLMSKNSSVERIKKIIPRLFRKNSRQREREKEISALLIGEKFRKATPLLSTKWIHVENIESRC